MGVKIDQIDTPLPASGVAANAAAVPCVRRARLSTTEARDTKQFGCLTSHTRVGLYKSFTASMDEGWTRWVMDDFKFPYTSLSDSMVKRGNLRSQFDVVVIPDLSPREVKDGMSTTQVPAQYAGGLGDVGLASLKQFVAEGGHLVFVDGSTELAPELFGLDIQPVRAGAGARGTAADAEQIYAPGSILRVLTDASHPVNAGMPDTAAIYFVNSMSFTVPAASKARVIARYPADAKDILLSGFLQGASQLAGKAAALDVDVGAARGRVTLFGFRPLYRGQSYGTFKMFFNALLERDATVP